MSPKLRLFLLCTSVIGLQQVYAQANITPTATVTIIPAYTDQARVGDGVTLDCQLSSIQLNDSVLWTRRTSQDADRVLLVDSCGLTMTDTRFSLSPLQVVDSTAAVYSHKITINPVQQTDGGYYRCFVSRKLLGSQQTFLKADEVALRVHIADDFPSCSPNGQAVVAIGSTLTCRTISDIRKPVVADVEKPSEGNVGWMVIDEHVLTKTVTAEDHEVTFNCFSTVNLSIVSLSCKIGPLSVFFDTTTLNTTITDNQPIEGLSGADIAGIVIGVIFLFIIIAVHTICCRCNIKRCINTKSYAFDLGSSYAASSNRDNVFKTRSDAELGNSQTLTNDESRLHYGESSAESGTREVTVASTSGDTHQPGSASAEPSKQPDPSFNINIASKAKAKETAPKIKTRTTATDAIDVIGSKPKPPVIYAQVNKTTPIADAAKPTDSKANSAAIYAQVNKDIQKDDNNIHEDKWKDSSKLLKLKNIKSFGENRKGKVDRQPKPETVTVYAELDLPETAKDAAVRPPPSDDSNTTYAVIKH